MRRLNSPLGSSHTFVGSLVQTQRLFRAGTQKCTFVHTHTHSYPLPVGKGQAGQRSAVPVWWSAPARKAPRRYYGMFLLLAAALKVSGGRFLARGLQLMFRVLETGGRSHASVGWADPWWSWWIRENRVQERLQDCCRCLSRFALSFNVS